MNEHRDDRILASVVRPSAPVSREFVCALSGVGFTLLAWFGPWSWPGWPAVTVLDFFLAYAAPSQVTGNAKAVGMVGLILINVGFWGVVTYALLSTAAFIRRRIASRRG